VAYRTVGVDPCVLWYHTALLVPIHSSVTLTIFKRDEESHRIGDKRFGSGRDADVSLEWYALVLPRPSHTHTLPLLSTRCCRAVASGLDVVFVR
jgi:hypothetical protein